MCFHSKQSQQAQAVESRFNAKVVDAKFSPAEHYNGFEHPQTPIITNLEPSIIQLFNWGLVPNSAANKDIQKYTLNARVETLDEKQSFKNLIQQRCLVIANGFYEWQWLTKSGSRKQKYLIEKKDGKLFAFAGLWSRWEHQGSMHNSYTIVTTKANKLMTEIHNIKQRMPIILSPNDEQGWLSGTDYKEFAYPYEVALHATAIKESSQTQLKF